MVLSDEQINKQNMAIFPTKWRAKGCNRVGVVRTCQLPIFEGHLYGDVSKNRDFCSQIIHFNRVLEPL